MWHDEEIIDAHVERSAQWCAHGLMGRPYEYTTHTFCWGERERYSKRPLGQYVLAETEGAEAFSLDTLIPEESCSVADYPVLCSEMFNTVVNALMKMVSPAI
jgi:hypothetical protein